MSRLRNEYDFLAGAYFDDELHFNRYHLTIELYTNCDAPEDQSIGFERIGYIVHDVLQRAVFVSETDEQAIQKLVAAGIFSIVYSFQNPYDVRELEAEILTGKVVSCLAPEGILKSEITDVFGVSSVLYRQP